MMTTSGPASSSGVRQRLCWRSFFFFLRLPRPPGSGPDGSTGRRGVSRASASSVTGRASDAAAPVRTGGQAQPLAASRMRGASSTGMSQAAIRLAFITVRMRVSTTRSSSDTPASASARVASPMRNMWVKDRAPSAAGTAARRGGPPVATALDQPGRLQPIDGAAERDRLELENIGQRALLDALVAGEIGQRLPLSARVRPKPRARCSKRLRSRRGVVEQEAEGLLVGPVAISSSSPRRPGSLGWLAISMLIIWKLTTSRQEGGSAVTYCPAAQAKPLAPRPLRHSAAKAPSVLGPRPRNNEVRAPMNHKHRAALHSLFAHPISSNIDPRIVKATLEEMGAEISHAHGRLSVKLKGQTHSFHDNHHSLSKDEVAGLRKFLTEAGVDPARDYPV